MLTHRAPPAESFAPKAETIFIGASSSLSLLFRSTARTLEPH